jgi:hypothetical protein
MSKSALLFTGNLEEAYKEVEEQGGRPTQTFTDRVFEAVLPDEASAAALRCSSPSAPDDLDEMSGLMAAAYAAGADRAGKEPAAVGVLGNPDQPLHDGDGRFRLFPGVGNGPGARLHPEQAIQDMVRDDAGAELLGEGESRGQAPLHLDPR